MVLVSGVSCFWTELSGLFTDIAAIAASQVVILYSFLGNHMTSATLVYTAVWQGLGKLGCLSATTIGMWIIRIFSDICRVESGNGSCGCLDCSRC